MYSRVSILAASLVASLHDNKCSYFRLRKKRSVGALSQQSPLRQLGLVYGAKDFRIGKNGVIYFLEINPAGQFLYLQNKTGLPILETSAEILPSGR